MTRVGAVSRRSGLIAVLVTGAAFVVGGLSRLPFLAMHDYSETAWVRGALVPLVIQAVVGCGALAWAFRASFPAVRLWWIGAVSVIVGTGPVVATGDFYLLLFPLAGLLVGSLFGLLLRRERAVVRMVVAGLGGHTLALVSAFAGGNLLYGLAVQVRDALELNLDGAVLDGVGFALPDLVVGVTLALGVWWSSRSPVRTAASGSRISAVGVLVFVVQGVVVAVTILVGSGGYEGGIAVTQAVVALGLIAWLLPRRRRVAFLVPAVSLALTFVLMWTRAASG